MSFWNEVKQAAKKLDSYLDKAAEIVEKAIPAIAAVNPLYAGYATLALEIIQFVERLTPELDAQNAAVLGEDLAGTDKLDLAAELLATASDRIDDGVTLPVGKAKEVVQAVYDVARAL